MALSSYVQFANSVKEYLIELDSSLDVRDGSAITDLLVNPVSLLLRSFYDRLTNIESLFCLANYESLSDDTMDKLASNYIISRLPGTKSIGKIRISVAVTNRIFIPSGTIFVSDTGLKFLTTQDFSFQESEILLNQLTGSGYYITVDVTAEKSGTEYNIDAGKITGMASDIGLDYLSINNPDPFVQGAGVDETNSQLYNRIQKAITQRNWLTNDGISLMIDEYFARHMDCLVIGSGDELMLRDRVYDINEYPLDQYPYGPLVIRDYKGKIVGDDTYSPHEAFTCISTIQQEDWDEFTDEFNQESYIKLYFDDGDGYILQDNYILDTTFAGEESLDDWVLGDDELPWGQMLFPDEIRIENGVMVMGKDSTLHDKKFMEKWKVVFKKPIYEWVVERLEKTVSRIASPTGVWE